MALTGCAAKAPTTTMPPVVVSNDFEKLWDASASVAEDMKFTLDRQDRRGGTITTVPLGSPQWFEPWRGELRSLDDLAQSSLANIRRTLVIEIKPSAANANQFIASPKVIVERQTLAERRVTTSAGYRGVFRRSTQYGTREADEGTPLPRSYWYSTGNDDRLARHVADEIVAKLGR